MHLGVRGLSGSQGRQLRDLAVVLGSPCSCLGWWFPSVWLMVKANGSTPSSGSSFEIIATQDPSKPSAEDTLKG